jgi:hypothetical protein
VVCAIIAFVGLNAQILMRAVQIKRSLDLPPQPPLSPLHSSILAGSLVGYAVAIFAILLELRAGTCRGCSGGHIPDRCDEG